MLTLILLYSAIGLLYSSYFFVVGFKQLDSAAADTGFVVRLLWIPASFALWPILMKKQIAGRKNAETA